MAEEAEAYNITQKHKFYSLQGLSNAMYSTRKNIKLSKFRVSICPVSVQRKTVSSVLDRSGTKLPLNIPKKKFEGSPQNGHGPGHVIKFVILYTFIFL